MPLPEDCTPCPKCGSENVIQEERRCLCGTRPYCWSAPVCLDCGNEGYVNSEGNVWEVKRVQV